MRRALVAVAALLLCCTLTMAQYVADYKRSADRFYAKGEWYSAAQYYEKYLEQQVEPSPKGYEPYTVLPTTAKKKNKEQVKDDGKAAADNNEITYRIAECYRQLNDYGKAEPHYAKAASSDKVKYPLAAYWYAVCLRANAKYAEAEKQFSGFLKSYTAKDSYAAQARVELANLPFIQAQLARKDLDLFKVGRLGGAANGAGANYAAAHLDGALVFTSSRADSSVLSSKNRNPFANNLYKLASSGGTAAKLGLPAAEGYEQGVASFTADGRRMYLTRWGKVDGKNVPAIYLSVRKDSVWGEPVKLGTNVNADGHGSKQPFVAADGSFLLYSSDRDGGMGKFDIWYAPLNSDGEPGSFVNLGRNINTKEDEEAPFWSAGTGSLVFASNGRTGMGGLDLYESKGSLPATFGEATDLGYPVNSIKDDSYFTNAGGPRLLQGATISTDRASACCLELFSVDRTYRKFVTGTVTDCRTNLPLEGATVRVTAGSRAVATQNTDAGGRYFFEVKAFGAMQLDASKGEYSNGSLAFSGPAGGAADTLVNTVVCLVPIEKVVPMDTAVPVTVTPGPGEQVALFDFAKYSLRKETATVLDTLAGILQRERGLGLEITGYTDAQGTVEYNLHLSQQRADACRGYLISRGVAAARLKATGRGECCPVKPDTINGSDNPDGRQANRRVEFKIMLIR